MRFWRISRSSNRAVAFDGIGAREYPGRWNRAGTPVVYTSSSLSLAKLEVLVHAEAQQLKLNDYFSYSVEVPDQFIETPSRKSLPADWTNVRHHPGAQAFGDTWATSGRSLALLVPSIVTPSEFNAILNPAHPVFATLRPSRPVRFRFDTRFVKTVATKPRRRRS